MITSSIYGHIREYLELKITLHGLEKRLLPFAPAILREPYSDDADVIAAVELVKVDLDNGLIDESEARSHISKTLDRYRTRVITVDYEGIDIVTGTTSVIRGHRINAAVSVIRTEPALL
jgi:hypothetical protein